MSGTVTLPWPPKQLSPNARVHWAVLSSAKKKYRAACFYLTKEAKLTAPADGQVSVEITFHPPCRRPRDMDNMLASIKAGLDGLADAMKTNDKRFELTLRVSDEIGGYVKVNVV